MKTPEKHFLFADEYLKDFNATRAYSEVYGQKDLKSASVNGCQLLGKTNIQAYIQEKKEKAQREAEIERVDLLKKFLAIANSKPQDFVKKFDPENQIITFKNLDEMKDPTLISGFGIRFAKDGTRQIELKFIDKSFGLKMLANYTGGFADRKDLTSKDKQIKAPPIYVLDEEMKEDLESVLSETDPDTKKAS